MKKLMVLFAVFAFAAGCGSQNEGPGSDPPAAEADKPEPAVPVEAPSTEPACQGAAAAEAQCVCPDDYRGEPACPHAAEGKPCDCKNCPEECECKGGDKPCPMKAAAEASPPS